MGVIAKVESDRMHFRDWVRSLVPPPIRKGRQEWLGVCAEAAAPLIASAWLADSPLARRLVIVAANYDRAIQWQAKLVVSGVPREAVRILPSAQSSLYDDGPPERLALCDRSAALSLMGSGANAIVVTFPQAALERTLPPEAFRRLTLHLSKEWEAAPEALANSLAAIGYEREEPVRRPGSFSLRGGILDVFAGGSEFPTRLEFFGDAIESIRIFDPESQRSIKEISSVSVPPVREVLLPENSDEVLNQLRSELENQSKALPTDIAAELRANIETDLALIQQRTFFDRAELYQPLLTQPFTCAVDYLADGLLVLDEPLELEARELRSVEDLQSVLDNRAARGELLHTDARQFLAPIDRLGKHGDVLSLTSLPASVSWFSPSESVDAGTQSLGAYRGRADALAKAITAWQASGVRIVFATDQPNRTKEALKNIGLNVSVPDDDGEMGLQAGLLMVRGNPAGGFLSQAAQTAVVSDLELYGGGKLRLPQRRFNEGAPIASILDLAPGDYVVHIQFGIGRYRGLVVRKVEGVEREFLHIEYQAPDRLLLPTDQLDRIQKFLSPSESPPALHRITGGDWQRALRSARKGAEDFARDLIRIYAKRSQATRPPYGEDSPWQSEMEATFPWMETPSQLSAIDDVKRDLNVAVPMDRLICGDVGFGKTEVAIRAAFKVAQAGRQVAVLCPTTILSDQHFETFRERLAAYPIEVRVLNRFRTTKERRETLDGLESGKVDIVIGTHALLQKSLKFKDLGLVIVDEEQRFGVKHKERLKEMRVSVDFLTMSATPIPRTLSMALMNIRQMSLINDPPPGRLPIRTFLRPYGEDIVREALLREFARGGQAFYVFNRVQGIQHVAERLRKLIPNARIAVAHGQMHADELEPIMTAFFHHEVDILIATTIIENGIDNPNVNTLIVEGADALGLAQLYQLRGRVGRSDRQAYCYLLYRSGKRMTDNAISRLKSLQEFSHLGSGYSLAFRDLQIRGAGELLGAKQHGLMHSVGYEMYVHLIHEAVKQLKVALDEGGEQAARLTRVEIEAEKVFEELPTFEIPSGAHLPRTYIESEDQRLYYYKRLMEARTEDEVKALEGELIDRYGAIPTPGQAAVRLLRLRILAKELGVRKLEGKGGRLMAWIEKGREIPLKAVHQLQRQYKGLRFRTDLLEWAYTTDALASTEQLLRTLSDIRSGAQVAVTGRA